MNKWNTTQGRNKEETEHRNTTLERNLHCGKSPTKNESDIRERIQYGTGEKEVPDKSKDPDKSHKDQMVTMLTTHL